MKRTNPRQPDTGVPRSGARHSTFRRRVSFAVPVVLVAAFGAGCGSNDGRVMTNPPPPTTAPAAIGESPLPTETTLVVPITEPPTIATTPTTLIVVRAPSPTKAPAVKTAEPAPPTSATGVGFIANPPSPPTTTLTSVVIANPPPPTAVAIVNPPPPTSTGSSARP